MSQPLQVLSDCPHCRVECAMIELIDHAAHLHFARCRLCGLELSSGATVKAGRAFSSPEEVQVALGAWAAEEGEPLEAFVAANFTGLDPRAVGMAVMERRIVPTSFDVVAWLFRSRSGGTVAIGAGSPAFEGSASDHADGPGDGGARPPVTPPRVVVGGTPVGAPTPRAEPAPPDPLAATRALVATALADGRVEPAERQVLGELCARLGAPAPTDADWRAWRPQELGVPPDPAATIRAMVVLALADRIPDLGEERVIREFARAWRVPLPHPVLPPVTVPQKLSAAWLGLFSR